MKCFIVLATLALASAVPQHFIADTPEVQAAKAQFANAFNAAAHRNNIAPSPFAPVDHVAAAYNYAPVAPAFHGAPHHFIADTPEVQAAKAQFAAAFDVAQRNTIAHVDPIAAAYDYAPVAPMVHAAPVNTVGLLEDGQTWPMAEPYIHEEIPAEPYIHMEEPYIHMEEPYVHMEPAYVETPIAPVAPAGPMNYNFAPVAPANYDFAPAAPVVQSAAPINHNYAQVAPAAHVNYNFAQAAPAAPFVQNAAPVNYNYDQVSPAAPVNYNFAPAAQAAAYENYNYAPVSPVAQVAPAAPVFQTAAPVNYNFGPVAPVEQFAPMAEGCFNFKGEAVPCRN